MARPPRPRRWPRAEKHAPTHARLKAADLLALTPEALAALPASQQARAAALKAKVATQQAQWTARAKARFLRAYRQHGNLRASATSAGCGRRTVYGWLEKDPRFKALMAEALDDALDALEREAWRRGVEGYDRPVYQGGEEVGKVREYSDTLLTIMLKAKRPAIFRERVEHSGPGGVPLPAPISQINNVVVYMPDNGRPRRLNDIDHG